MAAQYRPSLWERVVANLAAVTVVIFILLLAVRNEPVRDQNVAVMLRIVVSLAVAALGATIPGFLNVGVTGKGVVIRAGGALALFVITFFFTPQVASASVPDAARFGGPVKSVMYADNGRGLSNRDKAAFDKHVEKLDGELAKAIVQARFVAEHRKYAARTKAAFSGWPELQGIYDARVDDLQAAKESAIAHFQNAQIGAYVPEPIPVGVRARDEQIAALAAKAGLIVRKGMILLKDAAELDPVKAVDAQCPGAVTVSLVSISATGPAGEGISNLIAGLQLDSGKQLEPVQRFDRPGPVHGAQQVSIQPPTKVTFPDRFSWNKVVCNVWIKTAAGETTQHAVINPRSLSEILGGEGKGTYQQVFIVGNLTVTATFNVAVAP